MSLIKDKSLAEEGWRKIQWVRSHMPVLNTIEKEFMRDRPLAGTRIALSIHMEAKTAYMALVLKAGGAEVYATGCNPLSTQDDVAAALAQEVEVFAVHGVNQEEYIRHLCCTLENKPHQIIDDGGDLVSLLHGQSGQCAANMRGGAEETTTGVLRLRARQKAGELDFPMIAVNDAMSKYLFDNRYGTGQSVWDGIMRTTNLLVAGRRVVVAGYGWCGRGIAMRAKALGAKVTVCEVNPFKAIEAVMDGFETAPMLEACEYGELFITATGCKQVISQSHIDKMRDGAIMCNAGHFDVEVDKAYLESAAIKKECARKNIDCYHMPDGRKLYLLAEGRLVNLAAGDGHPAEIMDTSFALQLLTAPYIAENYKSLENRVYNVPEKLDMRVAQLKLESMGVSIDKLTPEQIEYLYGAARGDGE